MNSKSAQAAMEFLMTYGWAFLAIFCVLGGLAYFGVLNPGQLFPDKCVFGVGLGTCQEFSIQDNGLGGQSIIFTLTNGFGADATIWSGNGTTVSVDGLAANCTTPFMQMDLANSKATSGPPVTQEFDNWKNGDALLFNISNCPIALGERPTVSITLAYALSGQSYSQLINGIVTVTKS